MSVSPTQLAEDETAVTLPMAAGAEPSPLTVRRAISSGLYVVATGQNAGPECVCVAQTMTVSGLSPVTSAAPWRICPVATASTPVRSTATRAHARLPLDSTSALA